MLRKTHCIGTNSNLLAEPNKVWTKEAALLVVVISRKNFDHNENYSITHLAAWDNLAIIL
jgi:hypothetical protein